MSIRYIQNKIEETNIDEQEIKRDIIIERGTPPTNPIRIQEPLPMRTDGLSW
jgi:hypothetical protein